MKEGKKWYDALSHLDAAASRMIHTAGWSWRAASHADQVSGMVMVSKGLGGMSTVPKLGYVEKGYSFIFNTLNSTYVMSAEMFTC